jgi:hypothetical protein
MISCRLSRLFFFFQSSSRHALLKESIILTSARILHARLQLDYLTTAKNDRDLKSMLHSLPDGLEHTYETLIQHTALRYPNRIDEMRTLLQCLVIASPVLTAANLAEILAMQPGNHHLDFDDISTDPYDALDIISPFLMLSSNRRSQAVIKLSHYSLDEYLLSERILRSQLRHFHIDLPEGNAWMAETCLQYITFDVFNISKHEMFRSGCPSLDDYSFRQYASLNWYRHYTAANSVSGLKERCNTYLHRLFLDPEEGSPCYKRWQEVLRQAHPYDELHQYSPICFAISHGLDDVVDDLIPKLIDVNVAFEDGYTCLAMAAKWNRPDIVRTLLSLGADIEKPAVKRCTPLHLAAEYASRDAFDFLLDAGADPHAHSSSETTPFYRACRGGNIHIVKRLKDAGCDINACTDDAWTPIMEAVENGREEVLDLMIEWGADLTTRTDQGWTVLMIADAGMKIVPNESFVEKLKRAAPADVYGRYLKDRKMLDGYVTDEFEICDESTDRPDSVSFGEDL